MTQIPKDPTGEPPAEERRGPIARFLITTTVLICVGVVLIAIVSAGMVLYFAGWVKSKLTNNNQEETHL